MLSPQKQSREGDITGEGGKWEREEGEVAAVVEGEGDEELKRLVGEIDEQEFARACAGLFTA